VGAWNLSHSPYVGRWQKRVLGFLRRSIASCPKRCRENGGRWQAPPFLRRGFSGNTHKYCEMAKPLRFAPPDFPVHVWMRGNQKQDIFFADSDRYRFLDLLAQHSREHSVRVLAYCLMTNHVHLILEPTIEDGLSWMMMRLNSEYAQSTQFRLQRSGHFWQGRFRSSVMDNNYLWTVFRYVELNPVRANLVRSPGDWKWSSAACHMGLAPWPDWLEPKPFTSVYSAEEWREQLKSAIEPNVRAQIWRATRMNRPLASREKIEAWEAQFSISLQLRPPGRPKRNWLSSASGA
jgi:putative transposase